MFNKTKLKKFIEETALDWSMYFDLKLQAVEPGKHKKFVMWVNRYETGDEFSTFYLGYNISYINKRYRTYYEVAFTILHELGHIFHRAFYASVSKEEAEYLAEKFALKMFKKHYPEKYDKVVKVMALLDDDVPEYYNKAWDRIEEYKKYRR